MMHKIPLAVRLDRYISPEPNSGCWLWDGHESGGGYGRIRIGGKRKMAHRVVYEFHKGPIPDGLTIDHLCRNTGCVNPAHLEPVTLRENVARIPSIVAVRSRETCKHGHPWSAATTAFDGRGCRYCKKCRAEEAMAKYRAARGRPLGPYANRKV